MAPIITSMELDSGALLRLLQLGSPALPIGAYAYSQGLEQAVAKNWLNDEHSLWQWLSGTMSHSHAYLDVPVGARLYRAWQSHDEAALFLWDSTLLAAREARELQQEDQHLGLALARLLIALELPEAQLCLDKKYLCFATLFSLAAQRWNIPLVAALKAYLWAWSENQVVAATKLLPLGQTAGQRILSEMIPVIEASVTTGLSLADDDIGCSLPALAIASALHESQYSRLFRS